MCAIQKKKITERFTNLMNSLIIHLLNSWRARLSFAIPQGHQVVEQSQCLMMIATPLVAQSLAVILTMTRTTIGGYLLQSLLWMTTQLMWSHPAPPLPYAHQVVSPQCQETKGACQSQVWLKTRNNQ